MYTTLRLYKTDPAAVDEVKRLIDERFADDLAEAPGFAGYEAVDCGDGRMFTLTVFTDRDASEASTERAKRFIADELSHIQLERELVLTGEVVVNRANAGLTELVHA